MDDLLKAQEALEHIPASDRDLWLKMAMALKSEFGEAGYDAWLDWSQQDDSFNPKDAASVWRSVKAVGGIGIGTLFHEAKAYGWECKGGYTAPDPLVLAQRKEAQRQALAEQQEADKQARQQAELKASSIWNNAPTLSSNHPCLVKKMISAGIAREYKGSVVLPVIDFENTIHSLQFIGNGKKFLKGGKTKDCFIPVQLPNKATGTIICEGWATGQTIALYNPNQRVIAAHSQGNLLSVALAATKHWGQPVSIYADNDWEKEKNTGVIAGRKAAIACGGSLFIPSFPKDTPRNLNISDFNDLYVLLNGGFNHE